MKKVLLGSVATGALVAAGSANAADLPARPILKAPPPVPVFSWTGCFVGGHGGWGWGKKEVTETLVRVSSAATFSNSRSSTLDTSGAIFGGQIGCDYQFTSNWVIGIQGDLAGARLTGQQRFATDIFGNTTTTASVHVRTDWLASVTGRLGLAGWLPNTLLYVRGGVAWVREKWEVETEFCCGQIVGEASQTRTGWTIGVGGEYAITRNWSIFGEFNHYDFGRKDISSHTFTDIGCFGTSTTTFRAKQRIEAVKLGVNYRF